MNLRTNFKIRVKQLKEEWDKVLIPPKVVVLTSLQRKKRTENLKRYYQSTLKKSSKLVKDLGSKNETH